jgi:hypothetical protein
LSRQEPPLPEARSWVARAFTLVEDVLYIGLGLFLAACGIVLLANSGFHFVQSATAGSLAASVLALLDQILLVLLIVELLYTVQVSFREHALAPEPFLLVGLIATVRRVLVLTTALGELHGRPQADPQPLLVELGVLTGLILALAVSLALLRKRGAPVEARRA